MFTLGRKASVHFQQSPLFPKNGNNQREKEAWTDFRILLDPSIQEQHKVKFLAGSVLNLLPPGEYKRPLQKNIERDEHFLTEHWVKRKLMERDSTYYKKFINNFGWLSNLVIPNPGLSAEKQMNQVIFLGWTFQHDDILDNVIDHRQGGFAKGWATVEEANQVFNDILLDKYGRGNEDNFPDLAFPLFKPLCFAWRDMHVNLIKTVPHYEARNGTFLRYMAHYFDSYILMHGERINKRFSEESGKYWLRFSTGFKPWLELVLLIRGVDVPRKMRKDWYYIRLRMASEDVLGFINDIFGVSKDLKYNETDTLVMFKHMEKGIPFLQAYKETVDFLNEQLRDMMRLMEILRKRYPNDPNVEGYMLATEEFIDGYIIWCSSCIRYGGKTETSERIENYVHG